MDVLHWLSQNHELPIQGLNHLAIIPTVLLPLTALTVGISSLAGLVAGWFGIKLHTEGPKQFLEVLLKKRVLASMLIVNLLGWGAYKSYIYINTLPSFLYTINSNSSKNSIASTQTYSDEHFRRHEYNGVVKTTEALTLNLEKTVKIEKGAFRSGVISGESIFYGSDDGHIYEFDKNNLSVKRKFFIGTQVTTRPIIFNNRIYAGEGSHDTHHARIYSFDLKSGNFLGAFETKGHTEGQPVIETYDGRTLLFLTAGSDGLYAIDPITMTEVWHQRAGHIDGTVSIKDGVVYVGTGVEKNSGKDKTYALAYDFQTGRELWRQELPISNWMHPAVTNDDVCYVLGEIYIASKLGLLYCLNKKTGTPHFSVPIDTSIASKPYYIKDGPDEYIYFGDMSSQLYAVQISKKEKIWKQQSSLKPSKSALQSVEFDSLHGVLWYPNSSNGIDAFDPKTGKIITRWKEPNSKWSKNYAAVTVEANNLYHMDIEGTLRLFKIN